MAREEVEPSTTENSPSGGSIGTHRHLPLVRFRLFEQLKQRNIFRIAALYLVVCWLILEPVHVVFHMLDVPVWANRLVLMLMALGFPAALIFAWVYEITPEGLKPTAEVPHDQSVRRLTGRRLDRAIIAVLAVALAYFVIDKFWISKRIAQPERVASSSKQASAAPVSEKSIAVLPFLDMSEKHDQEYFADGMAEETLNQLAKLPRLKVIGRTSSFQFRGKADDLRTIGATLGAAYVLEGSVRRAGGRIRVTAQLINARDGTHLWSETYDRDFADILSVQDEIALGLARALQIEVTSLTKRRSSEGNPEAYDAYLRGLHARERYNQEGFEEAVADFRHSLELDPTFISAAEALAYTLQKTTAWGFLPPKQGSEEARASATAALAIDRQSAVAHAVLCAVHVQYDFDWSAASRECRDAEQLAPHQAAVLKEASLQHVAVGETREAAYSLEAALAADPLDPNSYEIAAIVYLRAGRIAEAERAMRRALSIAPTYASGHWQLGVTLLLQGKADAALTESQKEPSPEANLFGCALAYYALHRISDADASIQELEKKYADQAAFNIAETYAYHGKRDQALTWLDRALQRRDFVLYTVKGDPLLKNLESDSRYKAFLRKMNLPG